MGGILLGLKTRGQACRALGQDLSSWVEEVWDTLATRQRLGVRWQRCKAQACIDDTAFAR